MTLVSPEISTIQVLPSPPGHPALPDPSPSLHQPPLSPEADLAGMEPGGPSREVTRCRDEVWVTQQRGGDRGAVAGDGAYLKWREMEGASGERWSIAG